MERESFEDPETAALMNESFVSIKVDREERPDVDDIYMEAVQGMTGQGGWPLTVFLDSEGVPFYGGTYFPPEPRQECRASGRCWSHRGRLPTQREELREASARIREGLAAVGRVEQSEELSGSILAQAGGRAAGTSVDRANGGFGGAPKFPPASTLEFLLARGRDRSGPAHPRQDDARRDLRPARGRVCPLRGRSHLAHPPLREDALRQRAAGARVPARLAGDGRGALDASPRDSGWATARNAGPRGGFYSALDAESEGEEGRFYVWEEAEMRETLAEAGSRPTPWSGARLLGRERRPGNFEGKNILHVPLGARAAQPPELVDARTALYAAVTSGPAPGPTTSGSALGTR